MLLDLCYSLLYMGCNTLNTSDVPDAVEGKIINSRA
jgi:hypothetical protein